MSSTADPSRAARTHRAPRSATGAVSPAAAPAAFAALLATIMACATPAADAAPPGAQEADGFEWVGALHGPVSGESGDDMEVDEDGNLYIAGHHGGLDIDRDGTLDVPAAGIDPLFVKRSPAGEIVWIRSPSGPEFDSFTRIALDRRGGAYATGSFRETLTFEPGLALRSAGEVDGYLARYGAAGDVLWVRAIRGSGSDTFRDVASDAAGNVYAAGWSRGIFGVDGHSGEFRTRGEDAALIVSYDPDGALRWARAGTGSASWQISRIEVGPAGDVFVAGTYGEDGADFDGDDRPDLPPRAGGAAYFARFDSGGAFVHAWPITGAGVMGIAFASDGDVLLAGTLLGRADFDGDGEPEAEVAGEDETRAFLARYDPDGELRWARSYGMDAAWHVASDGRRFALSGFYRGERDIDGDGRPEPHDPDSTRESELAILLVDAGGRIERAWVAPGPGNDQARAAAFLPGQPILWVTGFIQLTADFSGDRTDDEGWVQCDALGDLVLARYRLPSPGTCEVSLTATARRGERLRMAELAWSGAPTDSVDIFRNGERIVTTANDGAFTDEIPAGVRGPYDYRVVPSGAPDCRSSTVRVGF